MGDTCAPMSKLEKEKGWIFANWRLMEASIISAGIRACLARLGIGKRKGPRFPPCGLSDLQNHGIELSNYLHRRYPHGLSEQILRSK